MGVRGWGGDKASQCEKCLLVLQIQKINYIRVTSKQQTAFLEWVEENGVAFSFSFFTLFSWLNSSCQKYVCCFHGNTNLVVRCSIISPLDYSDLFYVIFFPESNSFHCQNIYWLINYSMCHLNPCVIILLEKIKFLWYNFHLWQ